MQARFCITGRVLDTLHADGVPAHELVKLQPLKGQTVEKKADFVRALSALLGPDQLRQYEGVILDHAVVRSYVAVVTIHGVGDQTPNETARSVANLLESPFRGGSAAQYTPFEETGVRIATRKLDPGGPRAGDSSHEFTRKLLAKYEGDGAETTYDTIRLEGARLTHDSPPDRRRVHIYDMFWADLSQLGSGLVRVIVEFFLLIFHLGDLGRRTAREVSEHNKGNLIWKGIYGIQAVAVWLLACPIVVLNLYELAVVLLAVPLKLDGVGQTLAAGGAAAIIAGVVVGKLLFGLFPRMPWVVWWLLAPVVAGGILFVLLFFGRDSYLGLLAFEWCVIVSWLLYKLLSLYARSRDQSGGVPILTGLFALAAGVAALACFGVNTWLLFPGGARAALYTAGLRTFEMLFVGVTAAWLLLFFLILVQAVLLLLAFFTSDARGKRAVGTVFISLLHPTAVLRVFTLAFWGALWLSMSKLGFVPGDVNYSPWIMTWITGKSKSETIHSFGGKLLGFSETVSFTPALLLISLALVVTLWGLFPAVWAEVYPPPVAEKNRSKALGGWLTNGYYCLFYLGTFFLFLAVPILFPLGYLVRFLEFSNRLENYPLARELLDLSNRYDALHYLSVMLSGVFLGLFSFRGPLQRLALGFHTAVRVALDVDNYMREFPSRNTPRARIFARYASLLRYLCKWRDPVDGRGYGAIILVAHSQGTVITADLLRFLRRQDPPDGALAPLGGDMPLYLLTVGCPLRQLYGWRFPHLYQWAFHEDQPGPNLGAVTWPIPADQKPVPADLGLTLWVNAYRSGDYVGRYLWRLSKWQYLWEPSLPSREIMGKSCVREELCIGAGAHTRYFSEKLVGEYLDQLIEAACQYAEKNGPRYPA